MTDLRITLAEAQGWTRSLTNWWNPPGRVTSDGLSTKLPDPENDANDDYRVLEWARDHPDDGFRRKCSDTLAAAHTHRLALWQYKIGDYARAAYKVIKNDN